jgi:FAD:protein FMN transferase
MQRIEFRAMNCQMLGVVDSPDDQSACLLQQLPRWFEDWEQRLSRFRSDSELNRLNRRPGQDVRISPVLELVLRAALQAARQSDGLVNPAVLDALEAAGYVDSFERLRNDAVEDGKTARIGSTQADLPFHLNLRTHTVRLGTGVRLDLGGIAKGWAADLAARRLRRAGPAVVDAGGDIAVSGPQANGDPWPIGVPDPCDPERQLDLLLLRGGGVATSGRDFRRWLKNGVWQHHLIDPRSGIPAQTDVLSATVVGPSTQAAEMAAKVALISGSAMGMAWLEQRPEFAGLVVLEDGAVLKSCRWNDRIWRDE